MIAKASTIAEADAHQGGAEFVDVIVANIHHLHIACRQKFMFRLDRLVQALHGILECEQANSFR